jgi:hypothetical protein
MAQYPNSSFELFIHKFPAETPKPFQQKDYLSHLAEPVPSKLNGHFPLRVSQFEASGVE